MFFLFGLIIMGFMGLLWITTGAYLLVALFKKQFVEAALLAIPVFGLVFLVNRSIDYQNRAAEAKPEAVFAAVFHMPPSPDVSALRGYRNEDELSPVYLRFQASPRVIARLTKGQFTLLPRNERTMFSVNYWNYPPAWFNTTITPQTKIFRLNNTLRDSNYFLFYEPRNEIARVYFQS